MGIGGRRLLSVRPGALIVDVGPGIEKLLSRNGRADPGGPALRRLQDDPVLGWGDKPGEATCRKAAWRQVVLSRARRHRHELLSSWVALPPGRLPDRWGEEAAELILRAKQAALHRSGPWSWLEGCYQEQAWLALHEADAEIIELLAPGELLAHAEDVLDKARRTLGASDPRVRRAESLLPEGATDADKLRPQPAHPSRGTFDADKLRPQLAHLARATFDVLDDRYAQSRGYRNRLIRLTCFAMVGIVLGLLAGTMSKVDFGVADHAIRRGWRTVLLVLLFGSLGALVTAIPPVARANGVRNPFGLPLFQLLLKLAMGPLFAIVGVLILQTQLIKGLQPAEDLRGLLVWATLFGAAQQSVTRFIDQRVAGLLGELPGSEESSKKARGTDKAQHKR